MTAALRIPGAPAPELKTISYNELSEINPLIDPHSGDTTAVVASLEFLSKLLVHVDHFDTGNGIKLSHIDAWGLACLLKTCASALKVMTIAGGKEA
jgi:hypothetical protein